MPLWATRNRPPKPRVHDCFRRSAAAEPGDPIGDDAAVTIGGEAPPEDSRDRRQAGAARRALDSRIDSDDMDSQCCCRALSASAASWAAASRAAPGVAAMACRRSIIGHAIRCLRRPIVRPRRGCVCLGSAIQCLSCMNSSNLGRAAGVHRPLNRRLQPLLTMRALFSERSHPTLRLLSAPTCLPRAQHRRLGCCPGTTGDALRTRDALPRFHVPGYVRSILLTRRAHPRCVLPAGWGQHAAWSVGLSDARDPRLAGARPQPDRPISHPRPPSRNST